MELRDACPCQAKELAQTVAKIGCHQIQAENPQRAKVKAE